MELLDVGIQTAVISVYKVFFNLHEKVNIMRKMGEFLKEEPVGSFRD